MAKRNEDKYLLCLLLLDSREFQTYCVCRLLLLLILHRLTSEARIHATVHHILLLMVHRAITTDPGHRAFLHPLVQEAN